MLWLRTRPRNVTTAPSESAESDAASASAAAIRSTSSGAAPIANSGVTRPVYRCRATLSGSPPMSSDPFRSRGEAESLALQRRDVGRPFQGRRGEAERLALQRARARFPEVIERAAPVADARRVRDRARDVPLRARGRVGQRMTEREPRGDRRRKRAAGAVRVRAVDPRDPILD